MPSLIEAGEQDCRGGSLKRRVLAAVKIGCADLHKAWRDILSDEKKEPTD